VQISCIRIWGSAEAKGGAVKAHGHMMVSVLEATHPQGLQILRWESLGRQRICTLKARLALLVAQAHVDVFFWYNVWFSQDSASCHGCRSST
jgi:hypothetical protein